MLPACRASDVRPALGQVVRPCRRRAVRAGPNHPGTDHGWMGARDPRFGQNGQEFYRAGGNQANRGGGTPPPQGGWEGMCRRRTWRGVPRAGLPCRTMTRVIEWHPCTQPSRVEQKPLGQGNPLTCAVSSAGIRTQHGNPCFPAGSPFSGRCVSLRPFAACASTGVDFAEGGNRCPSYGRASTWSVSRAIGRTRDLPDRADRPRSGSADPAGDCMRGLGCYLITNKDTGLLA